MPDQDECTPTEEVAIPPILDPAKFEDFATFRETFLLYFTDPGANEALRAVGDLVYSMVLEYWQYWPDLPEGLIRAQLRAAVADMRHLQAYLSEMGGAAEDAISAHESHLCRVAGQVSRDLEELADRLEGELGSWRGEV
jgi:hypothetical protein